MGSNCSNVLYPDEYLNEYVWSILGPKCLQPSVARTTLIVYSIILVLGIVGNVAAIAVIARSLHGASVAAYYLLSLAVSDLLSLILGLPFELYNSVTGIYPYTMPQFVCKARACITEATTYASILTILSFAVERWMAICFPLKLIKLSPNRTLKIIMGIWTVSFISATPVAHYVKINRINIENYTNNSSFVLSNGDIIGTDLCSADIYDFGAQKMLIHTSFWVFFVIPLAIMVVLFTHIGIVIHGGCAQPEAARRRQRRLRPVGRDQNRSLNQLKLIKSRRSATWMLFAVVLLFFICWLPFHIQRLMIVYVTNWDSEFVQNLFNTVYYISGYFYYANAVLNPCIYNVCSKNFRRLFLATVFRYHNPRLRQHFPSMYRSVQDAGSVYLRVSIKEKQKVGLRRTASANPILDLKTSV